MMAAIILLLVILLLGIHCKCNRNKDSLICQERWNDVVGINEITVYNWDGVCSFPAGVRLKLSGNGVNCNTCHFLKTPDTVNGFSCSNTVGEEASTHGQFAEVTTVEAHVTRLTTKQGNLSRQTVDPSVAGFLMSDIPPWTLALIIGLATTIVCLSVTLVIVVRFRRNRLYCCKPMTSTQASRAPSLISAESVQLFARSRNPV